MKLNPDCIRDVLLNIEPIGLNEILDYPNCFSTELIDRYGQDVLMYHLKQCVLSDYVIQIGKQDLAGNLRVRDLSPKGHEFLANIRDDNNWSKTKSIASKVGSLSLIALGTIAEKVTEGALSALMNK